MPDAAHPSSTSRSIAGVRLGSLSPGQRALHAAFALLLVLVAIGTISIAIGWLLARRTPTWWVAPDPADPTLVARAEAIERFVSSELSRARPEGGAWRIAIPDEAATAWVNARLPRWLANQGVRWPLDGRPILVLFRDGGVLVATDLAGGDRARRQVVGARLSMHASEGRLSPRLESVSVGALTLPPSLAAGSVRRALPESAGPEARRALDALLGSEPLVEEAAWRVDGARRVRLVGVEFEGDRAVLTLVTEAPE